MTESISDVNVATTFGSFAVSDLESLATKELEQGQYLVRSIERGTGKKSQGCIVQALTPEFCISALDSDVVLAGYQSWLQETAEECCKVKIKAGARMLLPEDYSLAQLAEYLEAKELSAGKISKAKLETWFAVELQQKLADAFREMLGENADAGLITGTVFRYKMLFVSLAKTELVLAPEISAKIEKALELVTESRVKTYCLQKLKNSKPKSADLLGL